MVIIDIDPVPFVHQIYSSDNESFMLPVNIIQAFCGVFCLSMTAIVGISPLHRFPVVKYAIPYGAIHSSGN